MKISDFQKHKIRRDCGKKYDDYHNYLPYLQRDFAHRCCYCNLHEDTIGTISFQIDHFIPQKHFGTTRRELRNQYNNLMLACPKCNRAKSDQYEGDITSLEIENRLFYNPDKVDYNEIFYRNELGGISSDDPKGQDMINRLKLYRVMHNYAWILEKLDDLLERIDKQIVTATGERKKVLAATRNRLFEKHYRMRKQFCAAYREKQSK